MRDVRKFFSSFVIFFVLVSLSQVTLPHFQQTQAATQSNQFTVDYDINYDIQDNGETLVDQKTTITNIEDDLVPTSYSFTTKQMQIYDISVLTNNKKAEPRVENNNDETTVSATIMNHAVGKGRQNLIEFVYKTKNIAVKTGDIWNILIPGIQIPNTTIIYNIKVSVPENFGPKIYISPNPVIEKNENGKNTYYFTKESLKDTGIISAFGKHQSLNFKLKYQLENPSILFSRYEIALPMDIPHAQQISFTNINPRPSNVYQDKDGNVIGTYILNPKQKLEVTLEGAVQISTDQINSDYGGKFDDLPKDLISKYTGDQKYWEVKSDEIQSVAKELKDPKANVVKNAKKAYEYVIKNLQYNQEALKETFVERKGAKKTLTEKGSWTCMEFSDLFIALTRAMGIPAREINGYAFTNNESNKPLSISLKGGDLLHAWAEFYDPFYGWIQVDPTWGETSGIDYFSKMDTNHFTFVIHGLNSEYPLPAGAYRFSNNDSGKLVEVDYAQSDSKDMFNTKLSWQKEINFNPVQLIKGKVKYMFKNEGNTYIYDLHGEFLFPGESKVIYIPRSDTTFTYRDYNGNIITKDL